jgi:hypothetical protein
MGDGIEAIQPFEKGDGLLTGGAVLDSRGQQPARRTSIASVERRDARVQQLLAFALALGERPTGSLDISPGARVAAIEKQHPGPDADRQLVLP